MNLRLKYVCVLISAAALCWTISFRAVAQSYDSNLYNQYAGQTSAQKQVHRSTVKAHSRLIKKKARRHSLHRHTYYRRRNRLNRRQALRRRGVVSMHQRTVRQPLRASNLNPPPSVFYPDAQRLQRPVRRTHLLAENQPANQVSDQQVADIGQVDAFENDNSVVPPQGITNLETKAPAEAQGKPAAYNGRVDFLVGHDSNLDPNRTGVQDEYYQIDPSLGFDGEHWSGSVNATLMTYENQQIATDNQKQDAQGNLAYKTDLTQTIKSTSTLSTEYHNEQWPDYINGPETPALDGGMPLRYTLAKLDQKFDYKLGNGFTATTGAYAEHSESSEIYTDWAVSVLDPDRFRPSYNQYSGYGEIAFQATPWVQFALDPSITDQKYTERLAYGPDGAPIGDPSTSGLSTGLFEMVTSELDFNTNFKFGDTTVTPTLQIGQANDTVYGGNTNTYYGGGLNGKIMLDKDMNFYLKPSVMYTRTNWANFNYMLPASVFRQDDDVTAGLEADINITKTAGWVASYQHTKYLSNVPWSFINYNEDVFDTGIFFAF